MTIFTWTGKAKDWLKVANRFKNKSFSKDIPEHDCTLSPEDGCDCVKL